MRYNCLKLVLSVALLALCSTAWAQKSEEYDKPTSSPENPVSKMPSQKSSQPKVSTEFGLGVGARYNFFETVPLCENFTPKIKMPVSYGAALQFRLNIGRSFGIQPEIAYARSKMKITDHQDGKEINIKANSNIVQIPMLLSFRIAMFRLNFGPVFTLMDETSYQLALDETNYQKMPIGKLYPTVTYAAGISVKFAQIMMLDLRYADQFADIKSENQYLWTLDQNKQAVAQSFRTRCRSIQLRYSIVF